MERVSAMYAGTDSDGTAPSAAAERLVGLDDLVHVVANALNTVMAASELAQLRFARQDTNGAARSIASVEPECLRIARLLRDGRDFLKFEVASARQPVDLYALLRACADSFVGRVEIAGQPESPIVQGDPAALRRMALELIGNAFQFGASAVRVTVEQAAREADVRVAFQDNGAGITAPVARLFEPFFSTQPIEHSGLGLALATRIVAAHGGAAGAAPNVDAPGATFWVTLRPA